MTKSATRQDARGFWLRGERAEASRVDGDRGASGQQPAWNNPTTVVQTIRDALIDLRVSAWSEPLRPEGAAPDLERRPLDLGVGLWR